MDLYGFFKIGFLNKLIIVSMILWNKQLDFCPALTVAQGCYQKQKTVVNGTIVAVINFQK